VLETGTARRLDQPADLIWRKDPRQFPWIVRAGQLMGEVGAAERDGEKETQRGGLTIHLRWLRALLNLLPSAALIFAKTSDAFTIGTRPTR
jgi:hypothetical protein